MMGEFSRRPLRQEVGPDFRERVVRGELAASEMEGKRRAEQAREFKKELAERQRLARTFKEGELIEIGGREGVVAEPNEFELKLGNVRVRFGRSDPVPCNSMSVKRIDSRGSTL